MHILKIRRVGVDRMNRPPKKTIAAALGGIFLALSASLATAAGLGKLSVNSSLGQLLSAEIELVSLQPGEFEVLTARIASPEAYTSARIEYSPLLRQLRFAVERKADGQPILKITSVTPVNEPFVDLLVEMSWPSGRLVREYPILLDPPGFNDARVQVPVAAVSPPPPTESAPVATVAPPAPIPSAPLTTAVPSAKAESNAGKGDTYGPVKRGDTLAKIAGENMADGVSLDQMLVALFRENKQAFIKNNMNLLKTGQILRIPTTAEVAKVTRDEAVKEVRVQVADWKNYRQQIASAVVAAPAKPAPTNIATGQVATAKPVTPTPPAPTDQLKIGKADSGGKAGAAGSKGGIDAANAAKEDAIAKQKAIAEANARIALLEKQQADVKKLLELKTAPPAIAKPAEIKLAETKPSQVAQVSPPVATPPAAAVSAKPADPPKVDAPKSAAKPEVTPAVAKAPAKTPAPIPQEPDLMETVMDNLPIIVGSAGVLMIGGFLFMRRRKQSTSSATGMSQTSSLMPSDLKPNTITGNKAGGLVDTGNSSFLTDFDKAGPGAIDTDEVDPVAEAEVYIAYGRDAQAEEILKEAMVRDKSRHEISMKLLEIYHARKSSAAFETVARQLKDAIGENDPMWAKASGMGASIDPSNDLYGGRAYEATGAFAAGATALKLPADAGGDAAKPDLDFDLGFDDAASPQAPAVAFDVTSPNSDQSAPDADDVLDFDLDLNSPDAGASAAVASHDDGMLDIGADDSGGLDFDLELDNPAPTVTPVGTATPAAAAESSGFDFDLSSLSLDEPAGSSAPAAAPLMSMAFSDLSLDLDDPSAKVASADSGEGGAVATKLELAKAYLEIGDREGAKEILNEVSREGSAAQAQEAKTILARL